jgi:hypothetical protein
MPQAVTVYRWDDPGAPQIGSIDLWPGILNILKKCLVEGYGTKSAAGWTVEYEDVPTNKCVFRNDPVDGSGGYVQFERVTNQATWLKCATQMTGIDEYVNPSYMYSFNLEINSTSSFDNCLWLLLATKYGFYLYFAQNNTGGSSYGTTGGAHAAFYIGDYISAIKNHPGTFIIVAPTLSSFTSASTATSNAQSSIRTLGSQVRLTSSVIEALSSTYLPQSAIITRFDADGTPADNILNLCAMGNTNHSRIIGAPNGPISFNEVLITLASSSASTNPNKPNVFGRLPGCYALPAPFYYTENFPKFIEFDNSDYLLVQNNTGTTSNSSNHGGGKLLINCTSWGDLNRD